MSLKCYDTALKEKLLDLFPNVEMSDYRESFTRYAQDNQGKPTVEVKLPLISFYRLNNNFAFDSYGNDSHIRRGRFYQESHLKAFPVDLVYQIDIWSDRREEVDDIWRELVMLFYNKPEIDVRFDGIDELFSYNTHLIMTDNTTDIVNFYNKGRIHRQSITLEVRQAQMLFKEDISLVTSIPVRIVQL